MQKSEFAAMKETVESEVKNFLVSTYGENTIKSVVIRKRLVVIKIDIIKTPAMVKLLNSSIEKKFGNKLRDNQLSFKLTFINQTPKF